MNVGILGSGDVAKTLATGFLKHRHTVMLGTRDTKKLAEWQKKNAGAKLGSFAETAAFGEVAVLATLWSGTESALQLAGHDNLAGKVVMDATNPIAPAPPVNGVLKFFTTLEDSLMERLQRAHPDVRFVKAFNSVGNARMVNPAYAAGRPTMFICGNDAAAKHQVTELLDVFGWLTEDMGTVHAARAIEPLCQLWCIPGLTGRGWTHAFKLLR